MSHIHPNVYNPGCYSHYGYPYYWQYYTAPSYPPMICNNCCQPAHMCQCAKPLSYMKLPQEIVADATTTTKNAFIGGLEDVSLSLEYLKTGTTPTLKVTITENGSTAAWDITTIPDAYQIKENFTTVSPGAVIKLEVADCTARLRWCEVVCC